MKQTVFLGLDIGGSSIKFGWGNSKQGLLHSERIILEDTSLKAVFNTINKIEKIVQNNIGFDKVDAIGVGVPGTYDIISGEIKGINPNLPELTNINPKNMFSDKMESYIFVDNDANLMALAEASCLPDAKHVLGVTIGSGIGCGFVINNQIYHGANGYALELGHTIVEINGEKCNCGKNGCLEAYSSVNGILNQIKRTKPYEELKNMTDILMASQNDEHILRLINNSLNYLSVAIGNLIIILDVEVVVIGGGVIEMKNYPFLKLKKLILDGLPEINKNKVSVNKAHFGNKAGVIGAIKIAENGFKTR